MASDIGHVLRDARHSRGIALSDAARHTGVRETHLAAIERDELETYGIDPVDVCGIVRTYAGHLELDAAALLTRYPAGGAQPGVASGRRSQVTPSRRAAMGVDGGRRATVARVVWGPTQDAGR